MLTVLLSIADCYNYECPTGISIISHEYDIKENYPTKKSNNKQCRACLATRQSYIFEKTMTRAQTKSLKKIRKFENRLFLDEIK